MIKRKENKKKPITQDFQKLIKYQHIYTHKKRQKTAKSLQNIIKMQNLEINK